jgi:hypothetical protein
MLPRVRRQYLHATLYFTVAASVRLNGILLALTYPRSSVVHPFLLSSILPRLGVMTAAMPHSLFLPSLLWAYA